MTDGSSKSDIQTAVTVTPVAGGTLSSAITGSGGLNGYATGNARYLHIQIENDGTDDTLSLYAYNYAFGKWAQLYIPVGEGATAEAAYVVARWATIDGRKMVTVPIHGVDRIAFVFDGDGGDLDDMVVKAALSTF